MTARASAGVAAALVCAACSGGDGKARGAPAAADGARLYSQNCVPCHQGDGKGVPAIYPSLAGSPVVNGDATELTQWVLNGKRPQRMPAGRYSTQMLQFGWMTDAEAAALLTWVRANFTNQSPPVDVITVARARGG